jgi:serine O-acetyltransferase
VLIGKKRPGVPPPIVTIGDNCYIGTGTTIIGPVRIGNDVIIGAGSVVIHDIPDGCTVAGNPAKIIKQNA